MFARTELIFKESALTAERYSTDLKGVVEEHRLRHVGVEELLVVLHEQVRLGGARARVVDALELVAQVHNLRRHEADATVETL